MRVLTNPQIKIFHANLFKHVFIDLNQLPDPLNDVQTSFGGKAAPPNHHRQTPDPLCINPCTRVKGALSRISFAALAGEVVTLVSLII